MHIREPRRSPLRNLSLVWLVPLLALAITLGVAWQNFSDRGFLIEIRFEDAQGVLPSETSVRYRDVVIGRVESVEFTEDLTEVAVGARIDSDLAPYIDRDAAFWVVRPQVTSRGIEGLSTVLSGVYIEGAWDSMPGTEATSFQGLSGPPLVQAGRAGKRITLRTENGTTISEGAPVLHRGVQVGELEAPRLAGNGAFVLVDAFIEAPHDQLLSDGTRFWDTSGFTVSFGASGFELNFNSIASLVTGGLSFATIYEGGDPVEAGTVFDIFSDEQEARRSLFAPGTLGSLTLSVRFDENVGGLNTGADVTFRGLKVGQVDGLQSVVIETPEGPEIELLANISVDPRRIGLPEDTDEGEVLDFFARAVQNGLRARLGTGSFFSRDLIVELVELPDPEPASFDRDAEPNPRLPSIESDLPDVTATAQGVLDRVSALPLEELMEQAISLMASIEDVARADGTRQAPDAVLGLIEDTRALISAEETQALPAEINAIVSDLRAVVAELRESGATRNLASALESLDAIAADLAEGSDALPEIVENLRAFSERAAALETEALVAEAQNVLQSLNAFLADEALQSLPPTLGEIADEVRVALRGINEGGTVERLNAALANLETVSADVAASSAGFPELVENLRTFSANAAALDADALAQQASAALGSLDRFLADEALQSLPTSLSATVEELRATLSGINEGGAVGRLNTALANLESISADVAAASGRVPALIGDLQTLADRTAALDTEGLVATAQRVLDSADRFISSDDTQDMPPALTRALNEVEGALSELREGGAVDNVNEALVSAKDAADAIARAAEDLPQLSSRLEGLVAQAEAAIASYGPRSDINGEALSTLRELRDAARSVSQLARSIERSPNSLLFGR